MAIFQSLIDEEEYANMKVLINILTEAIEQKKFSHIEPLYHVVIDIMFAKTNPYNIADLNEKMPSIYSLKLRSLMNGPVRDHLQIIPTDILWGEKIKTG